MGSDLRPMQGWCLEPDQSLTPSGTGVRARVRSGAHLRVRPRRDAGTAGVGAGLEPRAGAHWRCSHMAGGWDPSGLGPEPRTSGLDRGTGGRNWSLRLRQNPRRNQSRDRNRVDRRNRGRISGPGSCRHRRIAWSSWFVALRAACGALAAHPEYTQDAGVRSHTPRVAKPASTRAPGACLRRHCWPSGRSLPEVVHLAEDFLVLDVAAVLLPQRRATHGALEAPHVPDEVIDLGRDGVGAAQ